MSQARALLITGAAVLGLGGPLAWRLSRFERVEEYAVGGAAVLLYVGWMAWESRISVSELRRDEEPVLDRGSMELAAAAKVSLLLAGLLGGGPTALWPGALGLVLLLLGAGLRAAGVVALGDQYSHRIRIPERVVTRGIYGWIRHPAYLGTLVAHLAIPLVFPNPWAAAAWALLWLPAVLYRTVLEDRALLGDPAYAEYARGRKRWVPRVW
ncbi:MAG: isoprenylcysteine carboxylmethyltransferase family protein [Planctomycetota bacterium]